MQISVTGWQGRRQVALVGLVVALWLLIGLGTGIAKASTAESISTGSYHACALISGGTVKCWGSNGSGQLGNGTTTDSNAPVAVSNLTNTTAISSGGSHSCALITGGTVKCWGANDVGQLGNGTTTNSTVPVAVSNLTNATAISSGSGYSCALITGGTV